mmetsp:Transcript_13990/g.36764  ORF Transcript_13990/g.36764 Transcript_13990/m.36764 type:complete len:208 (+) Transcript_13990:2612-3235(+)
MDQRCAGSVASGRDAVQGQGAGGLLPVHLCGAERLQRRGSCRTGAVHEMDRPPRAAVRAREHLCGECVLGRVSRACVAELVLANLIHTRVRRGLHRLGIAAGPPPCKQRRFSWHPICGHGRAAARPAIDAYPHFPRAAEHVDSNLQVVSVRADRVQQWRYAALPCRRPGARLRLRTVYDDPLDSVRVHGCVARGHPLALRCVALDVP